MTNRLLTHPKVLLRGAAAIAVCAVVGYVFGGTVLSGYINFQYIKSESKFWFDLFYFMSVNRNFLVCIVCIAVFVVLSGWIFTPLFIDYSRIVRENIGNEKEVSLPKRLKSLETVINSINKDLTLSKYAVKEAEQRKDDLVMYLAHDIRTPLTSVLGYLELLIENPGLTDAQRAKFLDSAMRKAGRMQTLVEELFEVARFSIMQIELTKSPVNLRIMLNQLMEELRPLFDQREIETETLLMETPDTFLDPDKAARAIDNVLHNAAYYTPPGGKVTVVLDNIGTRARIKISNTGTEVPPEKLNRFFEKFYRGEESRRSDHGSGLGLAIAKNIVEAHGGSITAENKDMITTFTITI